MPPAPPCYFTHALRHVDSGMSASELNLQTRYQFKYGCLHGVFGTPLVFVGGVLAENLDGGATFETWQDVLAPLLSADTATAFRAEAYDY